MNTATATATATATGNTNTDASDGSCGGFHNSSLSTADRMADDMTASGRRGVSRRDILKATAGAVLVSSMSSGHGGDVQAALQSGRDQNEALAGWIDAHSHVWTPDVERYPLEPGLTRDDLAPLSFTDEELLSIAEPEGVNRVVLIQHNRYHGFNNSYLIDTWRRRPDRFRLVGMLDSRLPDRAAAMRGLVDSGVRGFRIAPARLGADWLQTTGMGEMWRTAVETRQAMCCLINPGDLPDVDRMCEQHPDTPVVIDHFGRVGIDGQFHEADVASLCRLARHRNVSVKVSAFYALGRKQPPHDELLPIIKRLLEAFGAARLMWASDCPYQLNGGNNYAASIKVIRDRADFLSSEDREWLLRKTAERVFFHS